MKHVIRNPQSATARRVGRWRYEVVFGLLMLAVGGLCARVVLLVRYTDEEVVERSVRQQRRVVHVPGRPGNIFARTSRRYVPLAISRQISFCYADPSLIDDEDIREISADVGEALVTDPRVIESKLVERRRKQFVRLKRDLTDEEAAAVRGLSLRAVGVGYEWRRAYPNGQLAATVVGFRRIDGVAGGGLELTQDRYIRAHPGRKVMLSDALRRPIWPVTGETRPPRDGASIFLHLDAVIQGYLQEAVTNSVEKFDAKWGTGVVVDPQTGEVLAMCSVPTFDPDRYRSAEAATRTNRAVCTPFEPGSVFKPIIAAAAVQSGLADYSTQIFCENGVYYPHRGGRITDHGKSWNYLSLTEGVVFSSNICMAKVGQKLGNAMLYKAAHHFGFGKRTGIELAGESPGIVRPLERWDTYSTPRVPFGQEISVTALQLTMAFGSFANGGLLLRPRLVEQIVGPDGKVLYRSQREVVRRVLSPPVAAQTLSVLQDVVEHQRGTGKRCRLARWTTFGKTGTAQIPGPGGYPEGAYTATFVGGAPVTRPRVLCLISVYHPDVAKGHYGGTVAAPYVREVLRRTLTYLDVPPDKGSVARAYQRSSPGRGL